MTVFLGLRDKLRKIQKSLGISDKELGCLLGLSPEELAALPRGRGDEPTLHSLIDQIYLVAADEISPFQREALAEVAAHARRGGSLVTLLRLLLLYRRPAHEE